MTAQLRAAMAVGGPGGSVGNVDLSCVQLTALDNAIAFSVHVGCKTVNASQALATAQLVRERT